MVVNNNHLGYNEFGGDIMRCKNKYCIYNRDFTCILEEISINSLGMCDDCIIVKLNEDFIEAGKEQQRKEIGLRRQAAADLNIGFNIRPSIF
jgi:hypothetical protein